MKKARVLLYDRLFTFKWLGEGTLNIPASQKDPFMEIFSGNFQRNFIRPLPYGLGFPIISNLAIISAIIRLFSTGRPLAVFGSIVAVCVNAIKGCLRIFGFMLIVAISHIFKKTHKSIPPGAISYPPTPVMFVVPFIGVIASLPHINPRYVNRFTTMILVTDSHRVFKFAHVPRSIS